MSDNAWHWWQTALDNKKDIGQPHLPVSVDSPEQGFFRTRFKNKPWEPVAIWKDDDGNWVALRNGKPVDAKAVWNWACRNPITAEAYELALEGGGWADDEPTVNAMMGHNVGDTDDLTLLTEQIENAKQGAEIYRDIESEEEAGKAQSLRARMNELAGTVDKKREALKRPHLEAGKEIDLQWMPLVKEAKGIADQLRKYIETFKTAQLLARRLEERQRAEAEREVGLDTATPPPLPPADTTIKGSYGRAATVGTELVVTRITDEDAVYRFFKDNPDLTQFLQTLAQKALRAGMTVPGIEYEERVKIS